MDNVTNIYEEMLVKVFKEYIAKILTVTDKTLFTELKKNIEKALAGNQVQNASSLTSLLQRFMEDQIYYDKGYMKMFSYDSDDVQRKYNEYANFNLNVLVEELNKLSKKDVLIPFSTDVLHPMGVKEIDDTFNKLIYSKMQALIQEQDTLLEFKIKKDEVVYVLLIYGNLEYYVPYRRSKGIE